LIHARYNVDTKPFQELIDKLQAGTISAKEFQESVGDMAAANPALSEAAGYLIKVSNEAAIAQGKFENLTKSVDSVADASSKMAIALDQAAKSGLSRLTDEQIKYVQDLIEKLHDGKMSAEDFKRAMDSLDGVSPDFT